MSAMLNSKKCDELKPIRAIALARAIKSEFCSVWLYTGLSSCLV